MRVGNVSDWIRSLVLIKPLIRSHATSTALVTGRNHTKDIPIALVMFDFSRAGDDET